MKYLEPKTCFQLILNKGNLTLVVKGLKIISGTVPETYCDIMNDVVPADSDIGAVTFSGFVFNKIMNEHFKFFNLDKGFANKTIYFLKRCIVNGTYHWVEVTSWSKNGVYSIAENPNGNFFVEPWRNATDRKRMLEDSIFFIMTSEKERENEDTFPKKIDSSQVDSDIYVDSNNHFYSQSK